MSDKTIWERLMGIDHRILSTAVFLIISVMLIYPLRLPFPISKYGHQYYEFVDNIPAGETVLVFMGDGVTTAPSLQPATSLSMWMLWEKDCKIIMYEPDPESLQLAPGYIEKAELYLGRKPEYGVEFVDLGWVPGGETNVVAMFQSIRQVTNGVDKYGNSLDDLPIMEGIDNGFDFNYAILNINSQSSQPMYIRQLVLPYGIKIATINAMQDLAAIQVYLATGQLSATSSGLLGSAEMEYLTGNLGLAFGQILSVSMAGLFFTILVIAGNLFYFMDKSQKGGDQQ